MSASAFGRIGVIGWNTFREAVRQKFFNFLVVLAVAMVASSFFFRQFEFESGELRFIADFGYGAIFLFGSILAVVMTAQLFFNELDNRTALTMLAKPVWRWEFITGKLFGVAVLLAVFTAVLTLLLGGILWWRETLLMTEYPDAFEDGRLVSYGGLLLFGLIQWVKFCVVAAITLFVAGFANTNLYTVVVSFIGVLICQLQYVAHDTWQDVENSLLQFILQIVGLLFPNFQMFNIGQPLTFPDSGGEIETAVPLILGYGVVYVFVFLGLAVFAFRAKEV